MKQIMFAVVALGSLAGGALACSGATEQDEFVVPNVGPRAPGSPSGSPSGAPPAPTSTSTTPPSPSNPADAGVSSPPSPPPAPPADAAAPPVVDAPAPRTAFTGASAFASAPPRNQAKSFHGSSWTGGNCLNCHDGSGGAPKFLMGGRVVTSAAGTSPAVDAEVRVLDSAGVSKSAHTDLAGYFWVPSATLTYPALVGVRSATSTSQMNSSLTNAAAGGCGSCHNGAGLSQVHVP